MYSEQYEETLDQASKFYEQIHGWWMEMMGDEEYQTLFEFFAKENYFNTWEEEFFPPATIEKNLKRVLQGKDRIALIRYAFLLGKLVGRAEYTAAYKDD